MSKANFISNMDSPIKKRDIAIAKSYRSRSTRQLVQNTSSPNKRSFLKNIK
jgi:hypothetical protein